MEKTKNYLEYHEIISEELKYITNSLVRLKILAILFEKPQNMKNINRMTGLSYSSISANMHDLEINGHIYRKHNKYFLSNSAKSKIKNILLFKEFLNLLDNFFNILDGHLVSMIPNQSILDMNLLSDANLLEADDVYADRVYEFIENSLFFANDVKCILPFYYENFNVKLNKLVKKGKSVEAMVSKELYDLFEDSSEIKNLTTFNKKDKFLLIITDNMMILGLFKENGYFDKNRLLTSKNSDSLNWANNLFTNFKKLYK